MYFWKKGTILNSATESSEVVLADLSTDELITVFKRSVIINQKDEGDVTYEDLRLVEEELRRRCK
jgi:hypothetical protein